MSSASPEPLRPSRSAIPRWPSVREAVLARDKHSCCDCRHTHLPSQLDVHHVVPRKHGGLDDPANLITLCDACHASRHPNVQLGLARRAIERAAVVVARLVDRSNELPDDLARLTAALHALGKTEFREGQLDVILAALRGESVLVVRPTGFGKSLCFHVPALMSRGTALVLSPLKALMNDQVGGLQRLGIPASFVNGDLSPSEKEARYQLLEAGTFKLFYCAPERFNKSLVKPAEVERILSQRPSYLVVDEAHCVDRWGDAFRPDYALIGQLRQRLGNPPVLAFTATAGAQTQARILSSLGVPEARRVVSDVDRPNIALVRKTIAGRAELRAPFIARLLRGVGEGKAMIFVPTKTKGEELQKALQMYGIDIPFFHAKAWTATEREMVMKRFTGQLDPPLDAVLCTNAFGMGIDVPNVRLVIHWQHPTSVEDYLQEFGRAGRDGKPALALLLADESPEKDSGLLEFMAEKTIESSELNGAAAVAALDLRVAQIGQMNDLVHSGGGCFRRRLIAALGNDLPTRHPLAVRILERVFSQSRSVTRATMCCDACDPEAASRVLVGNSALWAEL